MAFFNYAKVDVIFRNKILNLVIYCNNTIDSDLILP